MSAVFAIGCDIGQRQDHSAICVVVIEPERAIVTALVKYPLGYRYDWFRDEVVRFATEAVRLGTLHTLTVDATGIGAAPAQMIQEALPLIRVDPFIFTNKSKRELVGHVKVLHAFGRLRFAMKGADDLYRRTMAELLEEMKQLQVKVLHDDATKPEIEVFKTGRHDDLFTALALAVKEVRFDNTGRTIEFAEDRTWVQVPELQGGAESVVLF